MKVTYYGHGCVAVHFGEHRLLFDPFISPNERAKHIDVDAIEADYILLTHGHQDHIADVERIAKQNPGVKIISNYEVANHFGAKDLDTHPLNHGGKFKFDFGYAKYTNAHHTSSFPDGSYAGHPGGFVIYGEAGCFYNAGDTGLTLDMKLIPMTCPKLNFAIFPIGDNFTMGYDDAAIAAEFVEVDRVLGIHYDTFGYIEIDHDAARAAFAKKGKELILVDIGETYEF